jgi:hypothetical protein
MQAAWALMKNEKRASSLPAAPTSIFIFHRACGAKSVAAFGKGRGGKLSFPASCKTEMTKNQMRCDPGAWPVLGRRLSLCCHCNRNKRLYSLFPVLPREFPSNAPLTKFSFLVSEQRASFITTKDGPLGCLQPTRL